jgi:hypothetical protein
MNEVMRDLREMLKQEIEECERLSREAYALGDSTTGAFFREMAEWRREELSHL